MNVHDIAKICHEANRAYCKALGDESVPPWEEAPAWQKDTVVNGVRFHLNGDATPEQSHENWLAQKKYEGWHYGSEKDPIRKLHPCMVPYAELPVEQRAKDYIFSSIVRTVHSIEAERLGDGVAGDRTA